MTMLETTGGIPVHTSIHVVGNGWTFLSSWTVTGSLFISVADSSETRRGVCSCSGRGCPRVRHAIQGPQSQTRSPRPAVTEFFVTFPRDESLFLLGLRFHLLWESDEKQQIINPVAQLNRILPRLTKNEQSLTSFLNITIPYLILKM